MHLIMCTLLFGGMMYGCLSQERRPFTYMLDHYSLETILYPDFQEQSVMQRSYPDYMRNEFAYNFQTLSSFHVSFFSFENSSGQVIQKYFSNVTDAMYCVHKNKTFGPFGYFCLDNGTWNLMRTNYFTPDDRTKERIVIIYSAIGVSTSGEKIAKRVRHVILILNNCQAQTQYYNQIIVRDMLKVSRVMEGKFTDNITLSLLDTDLDVPLKILFLRIQTSLFGQYLISIQNKLEVLYRKVHYVNGANVLLFTEMKASQKLLSISLKQINNSFASITNYLRVYYINLKSYCNDSAIHNRYNVWTTHFVGAVSQQNLLCVKDPFEVELTMKTCDTLLRPKITTKTIDLISLNIGDSLALACTGAILNFDKIEWYHNLKKINATGVEYIIDSLSYIDEGEYTCRINSSISFKFLTAEPVYIQITTYKFLQEVTTARVTFTMKNLQFDMEYLDRNSASYNRTKEDVTNVIIFQILYIIPSSDLNFNVASFSNHSGWLEVLTTIGVLKNSSFLTGLSSTQVVKKLCSLFQQYVPLTSDMTFSKIDIQTKDTCKKGRINLNGYDVEFPVVITNMTVTLPCNGTEGNVSRTCKAGLTRNDYPFWSDVDEYACVLADNKVITPAASLSTLSHTISSKDSVIKVESSAISSSRSLTRTYSTPPSPTSQNTTNILVEIYLTPVILNNAHDVAKRLRNVTSNVLLNSYEVALAVACLENLKPFINVSSVVEDVLDTVDNVLDQDRDVLSVIDKITRIPELLKHISVKYSSHQPFVSERKNFGLIGVKVTSKLQNGFTFLSFQNNAITLDGNDQEKFVNSSFKQFISIPFEAINMSRSKMVDIVIVAAVYSTDKLFVKRKNKWQNSIKSIISAEIRGHTIKDLLSPVVIKFNFTGETLPFNYESICTYWKAREREWSTDGCYLHSLDRIQKLAICHCNHLTNFAVLFNSKPADAFNEKILSLLTIVGLSVSTVGSFIVLLSHILFPVMRESLPKKILINLCVALILMNVIFLVGMEMKSRTACKIMAILTQYSFLSVFTWCGIEAFHSANILVFPGKKTFQFFTTKALICGWGTPIIFTGIGVGVWFPHYGKNGRCVINGFAFYYTVLIPVSIIMLINIVTLLVIIITLNKSSKKVGNKAMKIKKRIRIVFILSVLFGLSWVFGLFVINNNIMVFKYIFCILCSFQGLYIFVFYGIYDQLTLYCWMELCKGNSISEIKRNILRKRHMISHPKKRTAQL